MAESKINFYERILSTDVWVFRIGKEQTPFYVHSGAIEHQSRALSALVRKPYSESTEKTVLWPDVCHEDFVRFYEFIHTGDYPAPLLSHEDHKDEVKPEMAKSSNIVYNCANCIRSNFSIMCNHCRINMVGRTDNALTRQADGNLIVCMTTLPPASQSSTDKLSFSKVKKAFEAKDYCPTLPREAFRVLYDAVPLSGPTVDYKPIFLAHARLYALGDKYAISSLKSLTLSKLHRALLNFKLCDERVEDVVALIDFVYSNTAPSSEEKLRELVVDYVISEENTIGKSDSFLELLGGGGDFVQDHQKKLFQLLA
ncbi:hypothetical protein BT63DRAFT_478064 [Microthyrium microscopicum]|uniref:BTB domain-containing protein n=1 Tax=Microthyrium microscopicum TaxID=703497 RepID=A0A6A6UEH0_9PEZI|nr:hypothetical protein BT63DRAFT_478064 [Microthyrium microscopicum]